MRWNQCIAPLFVGVLAILGFSETPAVAQVGCGATLTTDTTLTPTEPVVFDLVAQPGDTPCSSTALILGDAITLDCAGLTLKGNGKGIRVTVAKGVEGVSILNCTVETFTTGIQHGGLRSHAVEEALVINSKGNGVEVLSDFNFLIGVHAQQNVGSGFQIKGLGNEVDDSVAFDNGKAGFSIKGKEPFFDSNLALQNGTAGFEGSGRNIVFSLNEAIATGMMA